MTLFIFTVLLGGSTVVFLLSFLLDKKKLRKDAVLKGFTGISDWRTRLNGLTHRFVTLAANPLLLRAASKTADPVTGSLAGQTLSLYKQLKDHFVALSYAYSCGNRAIQQAEAIFRPRGALKLVNIRKAIRLSEQGLTIREINPERYTRLVTPDKYGPKPPVYRLEFILTAGEKLAQEIENGLAQIAQAPAKVAERLAAADKNQAAVNEQYNALTAEGIAYQPYESRLSAIAAGRDQVTSILSTDPLGALANCAPVDNAIQALSRELQSAKQQLATINSARTQFAETTAWVEKVRQTVIDFPWCEQNGEPACWSLSSEGSNPDKLLAASAASLKSARQSLEAGNLQTIADLCKESLRIRGEAVTLVNTQLQAKAKVDEQVPLVRVELITMRSGLLGVTGGNTNFEMAQIVERTCSAVESRINDVHRLCQQQRFPEALTLITGTAGTEYGMPITKLVAQGKELLQLLNKTAQVANTLKAQTA